MKKNRILLPIVLLASLALVGCTKGQGGSSQGGSSGGDTSDSTQYGVAISNKAALSALELHEKDSFELDIGLTPEGNALAELLNGNLKITSSNSSVIAMNGFAGSCVGAGSSTITVSYHGVTDSIDLTVSALVWKTITEAATEATDQSASMNVKGVVSTLTSRGFILDDGQASLYVYGTVEGVNKGDYIGVNGNVYRYHTNILELTAPSLIEKYTEGAPTTQIGNPVELDAATYKAQATTYTDLKPVKVWGTIYESGGYKCVKPEDDSSVTIPVEPCDIHKDLTIETGKCYDLIGYMVYDGKYNYGALYVDSVATHQIAPTSVAITEPASTTVYVGGSLQLEATVLPANASNKNVVWSTSDANKATVSDAGLVSAVGAGPVTITVKSAAVETLTDSITLTIAEPAAPVTGISLDKTAETIKVADTLQLAATVTSSGTEFDNSVAWSSSKEDVATVNATGLVTAVAVGEAVITATTNGTDTDGQHLTATCTVTVRNYTLHELNSASAKDLPVDVKGTVVFKNTSRIMIDDGTGACFAFEKTGGSVLSTLNVNDKVRAVGTANLNSSTGITISNTTLTKVDEVPAPTTVAPLTEAQAAAIKTAGFVAPQGKVSLRTGVIGGSGNYLTWNYGTIEMETSQFTGGMAAGKSMISKDI